VATLEDLTARIDAGERLSDQDTAALASTRDIITLGMLATTIRRRLHGNEVTYVRVCDLHIDDNADLTASAKATASLDEASRSRKVGTTTTDDNADLKVGTTKEGDAKTGVVPTFRSADLAGEVRLFSTPRTLDAAIGLVEKARDIAGGAPLSAFCLFELGKLPEGLPVVLPALKKAGLDSVAQAPIDRLADPQRALESLADAGLPLARLTVNGPSTGDTPEREWISVCRDVADLQTRLRTIRAFAPLARTIDAAQPTTGYEDVKRIALARLVVDNVDTIQVDWTLYGPKLAQVALTFGADDIDSVDAVDDDSHGRRRSPVEEIRRSIHAAGFEPVERDGRFVRRG
jgi:aminodeoxyfutalosine synthase